MYWSMNPNKMTKYKIKVRNIKILSPNQGDQVAEHQINPYMKQQIR